MLYPCEGVALFLQLWNGVLRSGLSWQLGPIKMHSQVKLQADNIWTIINLLRVHQWTADK